jgi:hypothetical protein
MRAWILINLGIVGTVLGGITHFLDSKVIVSFSKPLTSGFEFSAENDSTVSQTIENLRVTPRPGSAAVFKTTESTYLHATRAGPSLPYGNVSQVPAAAYSDLDGQVLRPQERVTFRIPPLADWPILQPEASLVDVQYRAVPTTTILRWTADLLEGLSIMKLHFTQTYLVVNGYWTPTHTNNLKAALSSACAEDVVLRQTEVCSR